MASGILTALEYARNHEMNSLIEFLRRYVTYSSEELLLGLWSRWQLGDGRDIVWNLRVRGRRTTGGKFSDPGRPSVEEHHSDVQQVLLDRVFDLQTFADEAGWRHKGSVRQVEAASNDKEI